MNILSRRIWATVIDYAIFFSMFWFYVTNFGVETENGMFTVSGLMVLPILFYWFLYFVVAERIFSGTVAHRALNIKVVSLNGDELNTVQVIKRRILDPIDFMFLGIPALIAVKNTPEHQRLGDLWAKSKVI